jgi:hypothetical protein
MRIALLDVRNDADEAAQMHRDVLGLAERVAAASNSAVEQSRRSLMLVE